METAVNEFLKIGIFPLSPNVHPNCTFEPEETPVVAQDKLNSKNILLHRNLPELLTCKTKYLPLSLTSGLLQMLCCLQQAYFTTRHRDYSQEPKEGKRYTTNRSPRKTAKLTHLALKKRPDRYLEYQNF
jgi:hypothetical protein